MSKDTNKVLIKFSEISLKGKNRHIFENQLVDNIKKSADRFDLSITKFEKEKHRFTISYNNSQDDITKSLKTVYGIEYFSFVDELPKSMDSIITKAKDYFQNFKDQNIKKVAFKTKRSDKSFPLKSPELNAKLGEELQNYNLKVDYRNPDITLFIEIQFTTVYMHQEKIKGAGGLPVGTSGKVLVLLSGGIDSPVASALMMKRGVRCDFLHMHTFMKNEFAAKSKIGELRNQLDVFQYESKLFLIPYSTYEFITSGKIWERFELIFFKHYIFRLATQFAKENGYDAVVSGDNLNQVASQTMNNVICTQHGLDIPIFRPLLTYDKDEIVRLAKDFGTFELSIEEYKDCCSIASKNPMTQTKLEKFKKVLEKSPIEELLAESMKNIEEF